MDVHVCLQPLQLFLEETPGIAVRSDRNLAIEAFLEAAQDRRLRDAVGTLDLERRRVVEDADEVVGSADESRSDSED